MKIGFKTLQTEVDWNTLVEIWEVADATEEFDSGWLNDHFMAWREQGGYFEAWTTATALASRTRRLIIGHTVLSNTYRHPGLLGKMASTLDHVAAGRFILGLGAGWNERDHAMFGWAVPPIGVRMNMLEEAIVLMKGMWDNPAGFSLMGDYYKIDNAPTNPPCFTPGGPRIWLGTRGKVRGLKMLAQYGDGWATSSVDWTPDHPGNLAEFVELKDVLYRHCDSVNRDPLSIELSVRLNAKGKQPRELIQEATAWQQEGAEHIVLSFPAALGATELSRLAKTVAVPLRAQFG